jgi:hypothetical protein
MQLYRLPTPPRERAMSVPPLWPPPAIAMSRLLSPRKMQRILPSPTVRRLGCEGGLLLFDLRSSRLYAYNDTARQVWELIGRNRLAEQLVSEFAGAWGVPPLRVSDDVLAILDEWATSGLLLGDGDGVQSIGATPCVVIDWNRLPPPHWQAKWTSLLRGKAIEFAIESGVGSTIVQMFRPSEEPGLSIDVGFELRKAPEDQVVLLENGVERIRTSDSAQLTGALFQAVLERVHGDPMWLALLHGGAVARGGSAVGICGVSGSGKSTLIAALFGRGFDYLADDMIALSAPNGAIVPLPVPISVKPGSLKVLQELHPALSDTSPYQTKGVEARLLWPSPDAWEQGPVPMRRLVFPRFVEGAVAEAIRISSFEAVERLLKERIWLGDPMTESKVVAFLDFLNGVPAFAITYGSTEDGVRLVEEIFS